MLHEKHRAWIEARMIDPALAEKFGLASVQDREGYWLTVPYTERGETINHKWRLTSEKRHRMDQGAPLLLWNADTLRSPEVLAGAPVVITEGEWDALAAMTAGVPHVVSIPNGAPSTVTAEPENAKRYAWVYRHLADLDRVKQFIIAADGDEPGANLAHDLVSLLGAERCRWVKYPELTKDLNDVAITYGHAAVADVVLRAKPYPIKGLFRVEDFPPRGPLQTFPLGVKPLTSMLSIVPGTLTVLTGYANIGKSTVLNSVVGELLKNGIGVCMAPFETDIPILIEGLRRSILKSHERDASREVISTADKLIAENLAIVHQAVDEDDEMDLEWFLDRCRAAVIQYGVRVVVLDPWNELEHQRRPGETETEYTGRGLRAIKRFARKFNVAFWVVAHPAKPMEGSNGVPKLYQISGSAHWANKADYGLTYHRRDATKNAAELHVTKVRMGLPGAKGKVPVTLDFRTWEFVEDAGGGQND